ncbi:MAG: hypothetical protein JOZ26_19180 [Hyphomicrobiales bacterium]|nr:hypothetical protein [Hyphomicrobiales bacterium]MBV8422136.1 hypothetical protein [Hyphomicrobiales bacterium]
MVPTALRPIVGRHDWTYLIGVRPNFTGPVKLRDVSMPETISATTSLLSRPLMLIAAALGIVLAATMALWAHYGTAVFYEMIVAGIAACL